MNNLQLTQLPLNIFDAVFVTGLVRNNTTRYSLDPSLLSNYTEFCKAIVAESDSYALEELYILAANHLEQLQYKNNI